MRQMQLLILLVGAMFAPSTWADNSAAWANSYTLEAGKRYAEAIAAVDAIPAGDADAQLTLLRKGWLNYLLGQYNDSVDLYKQAVQQNPKSLDAVLGATLPLLAQQRWQESALYAKQVLEAAPYHYTASLRLLLALEGARDWNAMKKTSEDLAEHYPSDATALVYLARSYAWLGDKNLAKKAYNSVLSRIPGHVEATAYLNKN